MKYVSLLLALGLAGTVSTSSADPYPRRYPDRAGDVRPVDESPYHHQRFSERRYGRDFRGRWQVLARDNSARSDRQSIAVLGRGGRFERLVLQAERGSPVIHKIAIQYLDNPNTHVVNLETQLSAGEAEVIRLDGSQRINRIIVYTEPRFGGTYSIFGT